MTDGSAKGQKMDTQFPTWANKCIVCIVLQCIRHIRMTLTFDPVPLTSHLRVVCNGCRIVHGLLHQNYNVKVVNFYVEQALVLQYACNGLGTP